MNGLTWASSFIALWNNSHSSSILSLYSTSLTWRIMHLNVHWTIKYWYTHLERSVRKLTLASCLGSSKNPSGSFSDMAPGTCGCSVEVLGFTPWSKKSDKREDIRSQMNIHEATRSLWYWPEGKSDGSFLTVVSAPAGFRDSSSSSSGREMEGIHSLMKDTAEYSGILTWKWRRKKPRSPHILSNLITTFQHST